VGVYKVKLPIRGSVVKGLLIIVPVVVLGLILVSLFMPARRVSIEGVGKVSFETTVTLSVGSEVAHANPAISLRAVGAYVSGTANLTPVIPTAQLTGDMMLCFYGTKPYSDAPTINQGWTSLGYATNGTVAAGTDVGSMQTRVFYKIAITDTETNPTITNTTNNVSGAVIIVFQKGTGESWNTLVGAGGGDATAGTGFSVTASSDVGHTTGDMVVGYAAIRSDAGTQSSISVTITGCTMGTFTESPAADLATTSGGDMAMSGGYVPVNSGTSSAAPVYASTLAASHTGSAYIVRLRASTPDISVNPTEYGFGIVTVSSTPSTTTTYFTIDNNSTIQTDQTISVTTSSWSGGSGWTHSDTATPGVDTAGLFANRGGIWGTGDIIVTYNSPNYIYENCPIGTGYSFGLKLLAPTSFSDGAQKQIIVRITAVAG